MKPFGRGWERLSHLPKTLSSRPCLTHISLSIVTNVFHVPKLDQTRAINLVTVCKEQQDSTFLSLSFSVLKCHSFFFTFLFFIILALFTEQMWHQSVYPFTKCLSTFPAVLYRSCGYEAMTILRFFKYSLPVILLLRTIKAVWRISLAPVLGLTSVGTKKDLQSVTHFAN